MVVQRECAALRVPCLGLLSGQSQDQHHVQCSRTKAKYVVILLSWSLVETLAWRAAILSF